MRAIVFISLSVLAVPSFAAAQVVINEVAWMGSPKSWVESSQPWRYEWFEVWNGGQQAVDLGGWQLEGYRQEQDFEFVLQGVVGPGGYFVIGASENIPEVDFSYNNLAGKLVNSGQRLVLRNAQGDIVEELDAREGWFAGDNESKYSMERRFPEHAAGDPENWGTSLKLGGTPGEQNSIFGKEAIKDVGELSVTQGGFPQLSSGFAISRSLLFSKTFGIALFIALLSAVAILALKRAVSLRCPV